MSPSVCVPPARMALARLLDVRAGAVSVAATTSRAATPECDLAVARSGGPAVTVSAIIDSAPQAYVRLERTVVEAGQQFGSARAAVPPENVPRLGLDADWFPDKQELMTTDGKRLIGISVSWPGGRPSRVRALAEAVARAYLGG